jgi:outer membrane protein assembly factor BamB
MADDWPRFLGPHQNNTSLETGILLEWPAAGPNIIWRKTLGLSYSTPVVQRDRLVVFHRVDNKERVDCLNATNGAPIWSHTYASEYVDRYGYNGGPRASPLIHDDKVYTYGAEGMLTCLALKDGRKVWQRHINREFKVPQGFFGVATAPVIDHGLLLLNVGAPDNGSIMAFDRSSGKLKWRVGNDEASYATPVVHTIGDERLGIFFTRSGLMTVALPTGSIRHTYPLRARVNESVNAASPVVVENMVFLSAAYRVGSVALRIAGDKIETHWRNTTNMQNHWATCIHVDGNLYGAHGRHESEARLRCIELASGKVRWTGGRGLGRASMILVEKHFIALGERGQLALIEMSPDHYTEKYRVQCLGYPSWSPPVLANGRLYVRDETTLLCLDLRGPNFSSN